MSNESPESPLKLTSKLDQFKQFVRRTLSLLKLNVRYQVTPGVSLLGLNVFIDSRPGPPKPRSQYALDEALKLLPSTVLDVGSGGGAHARAFAESGAKVLCVDYGTSIYAKSSAAVTQEIVHADFMHFKPPYKFSLVWASHILEHQRNVGLFIDKLIECCADDGYICITLPDPHRNLWSGHLTLWSPGLLAYNIVLAGVDLSSSKMIRGTNEFSILFRPIRFNLPELTYDHGDLIMLATRMPAGLTENSDPWLDW